MKAVGLVLGLFLVAAAGFAAVVFWLLTRGGSQADLTRRAPATVVTQDDSYDRSLGSGYQLDYAYRSGGRWYGSKEFVSRRYWTPGQAISVCLDPASPQRHVLTLRNERCGQDVVTGEDTTEATPRPAPATTR
ncbi:hypothetical protein GCM10027596_06390 [Nocardioides korecus]